MRNLFNHGPHARKRKQCVLIAGLITLMCAQGMTLVPHPACAAESSDTQSQAARPKDAAEAVGEGNVQQWIEYYQRTRPPVPAKVNKPDNNTSTPASTGASESSAKPNQ